MTEEARKLYDDGVQAVSESRWEAAHALFLAARALHPHYTIVGNLGDCELQLGRYREAAENLALYVRELQKDTTSTAEERARAEAAYAKARAKVGTLVVHTNVDGVRVFVDGAFRGVTPLPDPLFVEPGVHKIMLEHEDYETQKLTSQLVAGGTIEHRMPMVRRPAGTPAPKPPEMTAAPPAARSWVPVIALGAASAVGLGVGVGMTVASNNANDEARAQSRSIRGAGGQCVGPSTGFTEQCAELDRRGLEASTLGYAAFGSYIASGVFALAAATYVLWPSRAGTGSTGVSVRPDVRLDGSGILVVGTW